MSSHKPESRCMMSCQNHTVKNKPHLLFSAAARLAKDKKNVNGSTDASKQRKYFMQTCAKAVQFTTADRGEILRIFHPICDHMHAPTMMVFALNGVLKGRTPSETCCVCLVHFARFVLFTDTLPRVRASHLSISSRLRAFYSETSS